MSSIYESHICSGNSTRCMFCLSRIQQDYQVTKLFQSSYRNPCDNCNNNQGQYDMLSTHSHILTEAAALITTDSTSLHIIPSEQTNQPNSQRFVEQPALYPSFVEAWNENRIHNEFLPVDVVNVADSAEINKTEYFVQELMPQTMNGRVSVCNPSSKKLPQMNTDKAEHTLNNSSTCETQSSLQDPLQTFLFTRVIADTSMEKGGQISEPKTSRKRTYFRCQCPNCNVEGGNKKRGSNGNLLHICHIDGCGKIFDHTGNLKRHLYSHFGKKKFVCMKCKMGFMRKDRLLAHFKRHMTDSILEKCQYPNRSAEDGNKTRSPDRRVFTHDKTLKMHQNWHENVEKKILECTDAGRIAQDCQAVVTTSTREINKEANVINVRSQLSNSLNDFEILPTFSHNTTIPTTIAFSSLQTIRRIEQPDMHFTAASLTETSIESGNNSDCDLDESPTLSEISKTEYFVQEATSQLLGGRVSMCNLSTEKLTARNTIQSSPQKKSSQLIPKRKAHLEPPDKSESTSYSLPMCIKQSSLHNQLRSYRLKSKSTDKTGKNNDVIAEAQKPENRKFARCRCSNCSVEGGNKTKGLDGKPLHVCHYPVCGKILSSSYKGAHLARHYGKKNFFCADCNMGFTSKGSLVLHVKKHMTVKSRYNCDIPGCEQVFSRVRHLKIHLDWHRGKTNFSCAHCDRVYLRKNNLIVHVKTHIIGNQNKLENEKVDSRTLKSLSISNLRVAQKFEKQEKCQCPNCNAEGGKKTRSPDGTLQHICHIPYCEKVFPSPAHLRIHLDWHKGKIRFTCTYCKKRFRNQNHFELHLERHKNDKLSGITSDNIDSVMEDSRLSEITAQTNVDNIRPQLACRIAGCGKIYYYQKYLSAHLKWDHGVKPYACSWPSCNRTFDLARHCQNHLQSHRANQYLKSAL